MGASGDFCRCAGLYCPESLRSGCLRAPKVPGAIGEVWTWVDFSFKGMEACYMAKYSLDIPGEVE